VTSRYDVVFDFAYLAGVYAFEHPQFWQRIDAPEVRNGSGISHKQLGENSLQSSTKWRKKCVFPGMGKLKTMRPFSAIYPARISTVFETKDVTRCPGDD